MLREQPEWKTIVVTVQLIFLILPFAHQGLGVHDFLMSLGQFVVFWLSYKTINSSFELDLCQLRVLIPKFLWQELEAELGMIEDVLPYIKEQKKSWAYNWTVLIWITSFTFRGIIVGVACLQAQCKNTVDRWLHELAFYLVRKYAIKSSQLLESLFDEILAGTDVDREAVTDGAASLNEHFNNMRASKHRGA